MGWGEEKKKTNTQQQYRNLGQRKPCNDWRAHSSDQLQEGKMETSQYSVLTQHRGVTESRKAKGDRLTRNMEMTGKQEHEQDGQTEHLSKANEVDCH